MKKKIKRNKLVTVTERDIKLGEKHDTQSCPVSRAVARSFHKKIGTYIIWGKTIEFPLLHDESKSVKAPKSVENFVSDFDSGETVEPFTFKLEY